MENNNNQYKPASRKDVALRANVSETIVSYVVNNNRYVSSEKKERVLKAIEELNYRPNKIALALKGKRTNQILFIADDIKNEHFGSLVQAIDEYAYKKSYLISLISYRDDNLFVPAIISRQIDGIIISSSKVSEKVITEFCNANIPVIVLMNKRFDNIDNRAIKIYTGLFSGIKHIVRNFVENERKNLAYVDRVSQNNNFSDESDFRLGGFLEQMEELGLEVTPQQIFTGYSSEDELFNGIRERIISGSNFNGIICRNDKMASVAIQAINSLNLSVPENVAIAGFDNSIISRVVSPNLTTMQIDRNTIGGTIIELIDNMLNNKTVEKSIHFDAEYIKRGSTNF